MTEVWCVMVAKIADLAKGERRMPYDLQFVGSTKETAGDFVAAYHLASETEAGCAWEPLPVPGEGLTSFYWLDATTPQVMRMSLVELDMPRALQPHDPPGLQGLISHRLAEIAGGRHAL